MAGWAFTYTGWHHVAIVCSEDGAIEMYVDGVRVQAADGIDGTVT